MVSNDASDRNYSLHIMQSSIETLTAGNVRGMRLPWLSRYNYANLTAHLEENPGKSLRAVGTNEYVIGERWRRRDDITNITEVGARKYKRLLVESLVREAEGDGARLVLLNEDVWRDEPALYAEMGFGLIERIVFFDRNIPVVGSKDNAGWDVEVPRLDYIAATMDELDVLLDVDHSSFPWLWWNSRDEMGSYLLMNDVFVWVARLEGEPVGYASFTMYNGWGHLDRLAVVDKHQGRGYGAAQLVNVLRELQRKGARNVGLSTQEQNLQSHKLYKRFDFRLGRETMGIYGKNTDR